MTSWEPGSVGLSACTLQLLESSQGQEKGESRSYWVSWNFMRRSAILNLFTGWGVFDPQYSM